MRYLPHTSEDIAAMLAVVGSANAEALLMAIRVTGPSRAAIGASVHPFYRRVVGTYFKAAGYELLELPFDASGRTDGAVLERVEELAAVSVQTPNFFGCLEDLKRFARTAGEKRF